MDLSFKKDNDKVEDTEPKLYFSDAIVNFSEDSELKPARETIVLFGQPVENRDVYIMERRIGCDVGAFVLRKYLSSIPFAYNPDLEGVNLVSMLGHLITDPVKVLSENRTDFYSREVFGEVARLLSAKNIDPSGCRFIDISGSFDVMLHSIEAAVKAMGGDVPLIKFSPFGYESFLAKTGLTTYHFGVDKKFGLFGTENAKNKYFEYDIEEGGQGHLKALAEILEKHPKVVVAWDCMVFSSEYFYGTPVPFPFSYSLKEITALIKLINQNAKKVGFLGFCHFNPAVEEKRSAFFLVDMIYKFLNSFEDKRVLKGLE